MASSSPAAVNRGTPAAIQLSNTSAHAWRIGSLVLDTSSATVAMGQASSYLERSIYGGHHMQSWLAKKLITFVMGRTRQGDVRPTLLLDAPDVKLTFPGRNSS